MPSTNHDHHSTITIVTYRYFVIIIFYISIPILSTVYILLVVILILFYKIDERDYDILKTFLMYLNIMPEVVRGIKGKTIHTADVSVDMNITEILRQI